MTQQSKPWRGSTREERDAARRSRLLDAGLEAFGTTGFRRTTVTGLCTLAGVSTRHYYSLYSSLDDLLAAVYGQICDDLVERIRSVPAPGDDTAAWLRGTVRAVLLPLLEDPRTIRILEIEMVGASDELERIRLDTTERIVDALAAWYAVVSGDSDPSTGRQVGVFVEGGMSEMLVAHTREGLGGDHSPESLIDAASRLIARLMTGP